MKKVISKFEAHAADPGAVPRVNSPEPALGQAPHPDARYVGRLVVEMWSVSRGDGIAYAAIGKFGSAKESDDFVRLVVDKLGRRISQ